MKVRANEYFSKKILTFSDADQQKVLDFARHVEQYGLKDLQGRNKSSVLANPHTKREQARHAYAQKHCLWHYHIGIPYYIGEHGDMTSEYILHYQRFDEEIVLVDLATHPPFELPNVEN